MKKLFIGILCLLLILSAVGCASGQEPVSDAQTPSFEETEPVAESKPEPVLHIENAGEIVEYEKGTDFGSGFENPFLGFGADFSDFADFTLITADDDTLYNNYFHSTDDELHPYRSVWASAGSFMIDIYVGTIEDYAAEYQIDDLTVENCISRFKQAMFPLWYQWANVDRGDDPYRFVYRVDDSDTFIGGRRFDSFDVFPYTGPADPEEEADFDPYLEGRYRIVITGNGQYIIVLKIEDIDANYYLDRTEGTLEEKIQMLQGRMEEFLECFYLIG